MPNMIVTTNIIVIVVIFICYISKYILGTTVILPSQGPTKHQPVNNFLAIFSCLNTGSG